MVKGLKIGLAASLLLNVGLIVGFLSFREYVGSHSKKAVVSAAQAEQAMLQNILSELESNDPARIAALKERLQTQIEAGNEAIAMWQQIATQ